MASEVKYKKGGGNSCAVNGCSNNRRKLNEWKQTFVNYINKNMKTVLV
jgi:hypothetical protein